MNASSTLKYLWTLQAPVWMKEVLEVLSYFQMFFLTAHKIIKKTKPPPHQKINKKKAPNKQTTTKEKKKTTISKSPKPTFTVIFQEEKIIFEELTYIIKNFLKKVYFFQKHVWAMTGCLLLLDMQWALFKMELINYQSITSTTPEAVQIL